MPEAQAPITPDSESNVNPQLSSNVRVSSDGNVTTVDISLSSLSQDRAIELERQNAQLLSERDRLKEENKFLRDEQHLGTKGYLWLAGSVTVLAASEAFNAYTSSRQQNTLDTCQNQLGSCLDQCHPLRSATESVESAIPTELPQPLTKGTTLVVSSTGTESDGATATGSRIAR